MVENAKIANEIFRKHTEERKNMDKLTSDEIKIQACKIEAIQHFNRALEEAGGCGYDQFKNVTVEEFMNVVSQNGIRVCFSQQWHMNRLNPNIDLFTESVNQLISKTI